MYTVKNICLTQQEAQAMHITPHRRRRALRVRYYSQRNLSHKDIAEKLNVSRATVRADLQFVETHWASLASAAADDLLLDSLYLLQLRLSLAIQTDEVGEQATRLTPTEYLRARDARQTRLNAHEVQQRAAQRPDQPELYEEDSQDLSETTPKSAQIDPPNSTIFSTEQEIAAVQPKTEKIPADPHLESEIPKVAA